MGQKLDLLTERPKNETSLREALKIRRPEPPTEKLVTIAVFDQPSYQAHSSAPLPFQLLKPSAADAEGCKEAFLPFGGRTCRS